MGENGREVRGKCRLGCRGGFNLSRGDTQSLSANILTGVPDELFHIRVSADYYRPPRNIPFSVPGETSRHKFDFSRAFGYNVRSYVG